MDHAKSKAPKTHTSRAGRTVKRPGNINSKCSQKGPPGAEEDPRPGGGEKASPDYQELLKQVVARANAGDREALARLRKFLDVNPGIWRRAGDLTAIAEDAWIALVAGQNRLVSESLKRRLADLKTDLKGSHPTPLEALLADQVAICSLAAGHAEIQAASAETSSLDQASFRLRRAESGQKRFLNAVKVLATLRALVPGGMVPLSGLKLHAPPAEEVG